MFGHYALALGPGVRGVAYGTPGAGGIPPQARQAFRPLQSRSCPGPFTTTLRAASEAGSLKGVNRGRVRRVDRLALSFSFDSISSMFQTKDGAHEKGDVEGEIGGTTTTAWCPSRGRRRSPTWTVRIADQEVLRRRRRTSPYRAAIQAELRAEAPLRARSEQDVDGAVLQDRPGSTTGGRCGA